MPRRSNLFQDVVAILQRHLVGDAQVEESGMLRSRTTGEEREVDVVIRADAGYPVLISVEAVGRRRKADRIWVDSMVGKHDDLPTNVLVLVSQRGFSDNARAAAVASGALPLAPEDLADDDPGFKVVNAIPSLWPKVVSFTPEKARVTVDRPGEGVAWFWATPDLHIFFDNGEEVDALLPLFKSAYDAQWPRLMEQIDLANIGEDMDRFFHLRIGPVQTSNTDGNPHHLCLRMEEGPQAGELHPVKRIDVFGKAVIRVSEVPLSHHRLGEVMYSYGEGRVGDRDALLVASEDSEGGKLTVRFRDGDTRTHGLHG